jgi:hypothetical protein
MSRVSPAEAARAVREIVDLIAPAVRSLVKDEQLDPGMLDTLAKAEAAIGILTFVDKYADEIRRIAR